MAKKSGGKPPPKPPAKPPSPVKKQSSSGTSSLAAKILNGSKKPTIADAKKLAASVMSQDERKGN